ncbi:MAG: hypothetical protein ACREPM_09360 [Gemmatimonadaceae bacterium]
MASRFRTRPIIVDAVQWDGTRAGEAVIEAFVGTQLGVSIDGDGPIGEQRQLMIRTPLGPHYVSSGDRVIRGAGGDCYPSKPDAFTAMYEPVEGTP